MCLNIVKSSQPIKPSQSLGSKSSLKPETDKIKQPSINIQSTIKTGTYSDGLDNQFDFPVPNDNKKLKSLELSLPAKSNTKVYEINNQLLQGLVKNTIKPPFAVNISGTPITITAKMLDDIKETEFQKGNGKITDVLKLGDGKLTKGYGCTDTSLHPYIKDEESAKAVLAYQLCTHMQERFSFIPKVFLKNLNENQIKALAGVAINISPEGFKGDTGLFKPVKYLIDMEKKFINKTVDEVKDVIDNAMAFFVSKKNASNPKFEGGLSSRRTSEFLMANGITQKDPYNKENLAIALRRMENAGKDSATTVINTLQSIAGRVGAEWRSIFRK